MPVRKNDSIHAFEKGSSKKALKFYDDVINSAVERRIVPAEVRLIKRKKLIAKRNFGPVDELKKFRIVRTKIKV